jgi:glutamyl-tRNA synthetase
MAAPTRFAAFSIRRMTPMPDPVITRFAPSPTGFLHIGGARTALFNWLFARHAGGKMLLRIEDTDRERSTDAAIAAILDGLSWLGLDWDGDVIHQFQRAARHREATEQLLASGNAYFCYATPQELDAMREKARAAAVPPRYDGRWRDRPASDARPGVKPVVRLKAAREGETVLDDKVQGRVAWANKDLDDLVLLRSDGTPTYMLAVVVDDHDMGVTHIIRGDDHLTNAARQMQIYQALGWEAPVMAHIPLIHGADGAKLSKRHGALGVDAYRAMGYLPEALRNYLVRLGWSQGNKEFFSTREMIEAFDLAHVGRAPARFDFAKLESMNGHYIRNTPDEALASALETALTYLPAGAGVSQKLDDTMRAKLRASMPGLKERAKTLIELLDGAKFLFVDRPLVLDDKATYVLRAGPGKVRVDSPGAEFVVTRGAGHIAALIPRFAALPEWNAASLEATVRDYAGEIKVKLGDVAQPLRAALTGRTVSPGIFDVLEVLGREESLARLRDQAG